MEDQINLYKFFTFILSMTLFLALVVILVLSLGISLSRQSQVVTPATAVVTDVDILTQSVYQEGQDYCQKLAASCTGDDCIATSDSSLCLNDFYAQKASTAGNSALCDLVDNSTKQLSCRDVVFTSLAVGNQDLKECAKLSKPEHREACANEVNYFLAGSNPDQAAAYCSVITSPSLKAKCLSR